MSYVNYLNKLSSNTKKVLEDTSIIQEDLKRYKEFIGLLPKYNKNTIGYKVKYIFEIDSEFKNPYYFTALQAILTYIIELYISHNEMSFFKYNFSVYNDNLNLAIFHTNKLYLENVSEHVINYISNELESLCSKINSKFLDSSNILLRIKIKLLQKEFPILVDILTNLVKEKKMGSKVNEITEAIIKLIYTNDVNIHKENEMRLTTLKSDEDPLTFLTNQLEENKRKMEDRIPERNKKLKTEDEEIENETVNDNLNQLYWHTNEKHSKSSNWIHAIIFLLVLALLIYTVPNFIQKFIQFSNNNSVIDNILDLATEDLNKNNKSNFNKALSKLETIAETNNEPHAPFEPDAPFEPNAPYEPFSSNDHNDDIGLITKNIIKKFNDNENTNNELRNIENRLKFILEETDTKN